MRRTIFILAIGLAPIIINAQVPSVSNQYMLNPLEINPAYAGGRKALNFAAFYRKQWVGITGSPETMTLTGDASLLENKLGLGFMLINDKIGVTKESRLNTFYSYKIHLADGDLSFGLGAGVMTTNTKWSDLVVLDPGDEVYLSDSRTFVVPDFSFGTYLSFKKFFAGISIPRLLGYEFNYNKNRYSITVTPEKYYYFFNTGYLITISPNLKFLPSTLVNIYPGQRPLVDLNGHFLILDRIWIGGTYRSTNSMAALVQVSLIKQLKIAYTYDYDFANLGKYSNGSHEIMIRYEFRYNVNVVNPLGL